MNSMYLTMDFAKGIYMVDWASFTKTIKKTVIKCGYKLV
jgi:phage anti-repressor protein